MKINIGMLNYVKNIYGGVNMSEMVALYDTIVKHLKCPEGIAADLGSHEGKSSVTAVAALSSLNRSDDFYLVEVIEFDKPDVKERVKERAMKYSSGTVTLVCAFSVDFLDQHAGPFSYVFIDTDHFLECVMGETERLEDKMHSGGLIFFHDFKNQYTEPAQAYDYLISTGKYEEIKIDWEFAIELTKEHELEKNNVTFGRYDGVHAPSLGELSSFEYPTFIGCVRRI